MNPENLEIVIASYKENIWYIPHLEKIGCRITLYNANGGNIKSFRVHPITRAAYGFTPIETCIPVPNLAREGSQWLHHLVSRYDSLSDYTLFLQADLGQSIHCYSPERYGANHARLYQLLGWIDRIPDAVDFLPYDSSYLDPFALNPADTETLAPYFSPLVPPVLSSVQPPGGQFMGSKEFFTRIPKSHFQKMLDECSVNSGFAHFAEFRWPGLLDCFGEVWPYTPKAVEFNTTQQ